MIVMLYILSAEEIKHSGHSFTDAEVHTRAPTASHGTDSKEGRAFIHDF